MDEGMELYRIALTSVDLRTTTDGVEELVLHTDVGDIEARYHAAVGGDGAVIWVGGAAGGLDGPAGGLYSRLAVRLAGDQVASLRMHYRYPNDLIDCVLDTLIGVEYVKLRKRSRVALVGHSFGGVVAINAGAASDAVIGVVALSSQITSAADVMKLSPRALLLIHGTGDEVIPDACSRYLYQHAWEPKKILLYPGCGHELDACRDEVDRDLLSWLLALSGGMEGTMGSG